MTGTSVAEAARSSGASRSTVRDWIAAGKVHCHRDGSVSSRGMKNIASLVAQLAEEAEADTENAQLRAQLLRHQVREREAISRLRELELEHESGRFVELAVVQRDLADAAERMLGVLRAIAQRVAREVEAALSAPVDRRAALVETIITREIERAIAEMRRSVYLAPAEASTPAPRDTSRNRRSPANTTPREDD